MKFSHPYLLNLLWFFVVTFGIITYGMHQRKKIIAAFMRHELLRKMVPGYSPERRWIKACLILLAAAFGIVSLAGPLAGFRWEKIEQKGVDIMIALDCSKSMLARDIKPDRLARAKREIIDLLRMMKSDRAGLVAFAGRAILQCPLTLDHEAFHIFLNVLEPGFLPMGGTNLEEAVRTAYDGFEKDSDTQKAIILITDGEHTSGDVEAIAGEMAKLGVKIFSIGVGDPSGAPIPDETGGFKKDRDGRIVMSKVDEEGLKKMAAVTGGAYVRSVAGDMDLDLIYTDKILGTMERKKLSSGRKKVWENRFQWFLFPCVVLLMIELLIAPAKRAARLPVIVMICLIGTLPGTGGPAYADSVSGSVKQGIRAFEAGQYEQAKKHFIDAQLKDPENDKIYFNMGTAAYMNKEFQQAENNFRLAARTTDDQLKHNALYNLANTQYRLGKLDDAINGYETIIKEFPEDTQARENLEFVKKKKQEQQKQDKGDQKNPEKNPPGKDEKDGRSDPNPSKQNPSKQMNPEQNKDNPAGPDPERQNPGAEPRQKPETGQQPEKKETHDPVADPQNAVSAKAQKQDRSGRGRHLDKKLNRLEDKPGRAMIPRDPGQMTDKDW